MNNSRENRQRLCTGFDSPLGVSRREALSHFGHGLGAMALATLLNGDRAMGAATRRQHPPACESAKRVIFLFQSGAPSQIESFDYKPLLNERHGEQLPDSVRQGQRLTGMSAHQASLPMVGSPFKFAQHGQSGAWVSEQMPHIAKHVDDLCFIKSVLHRSNQPRTRCDLHADGLTISRPSQHGCLALLRFRVQQQRPCPRLWYWSPTDKVASRWCRGFGAVVSCLASMTAYDCAATPTPCCT